jgi:hypothetical protein
MSSQDYWIGDGISITGNPGGDSADTISFGDISDSFLAAGPVDLDPAVGQDVVTFTNSVTINNDNGRWKYNEDVVLKEIQEYLGSTYRSHYTSVDSKTQTLDLIEAIGDAEAFTRSNAIKYLSRFGKKDGKSKMDILKAIHYCILLYHFSGLSEKKDSTYNY